MSAPNFKYVEDVSHWVPWQQRYKYGVLLIVPTDDVISPMDKLRQSHDPESASYCQAHISVSDPLPRALTANDLEDVQKAIAEIKPFEIQFGPIITFPPHTGVCYKIEPEEPFWQLREALHGMKLFEGAELRRHTIPPHLTIAELGLVDKTTQYDRSEDLKKQLQDTVASGSFMCGGIEYLVPNQDFYFERVLKIPFPVPQQPSPTPAIGAAP